jgi:hypothetical protein
MTNKYSLTAWHNDDRFANEWDQEVTYKNGKEEGRKLCHT